MKKIISILLLGIFVSSNAQTSIFNSLLQKHVDKQGNVDYKELKTDEVRLNTYIDYLAATSPEKSWSVNKQKAFWINAYTIQLILDNYPLNLSSINI